MAERIKKHWDIALIFGVGLILMMVVVTGVVSWPSPVLSEEVTVSATVNEWMTFLSTASSTTLLPDLVALDGSTHIASSSAIYFNIGTNSANGYSVTVTDSNNGLDSAGTKIQLSTATGTVSAGNDSYGIQATSSLMTVEAKYDYETTTNDVGQVSTVASDFVTDNSPGINQMVWMRIAAGCDATQANGSYSDVLTFTLSGTP
ncbi:MAG: hypothetical protein V1756_00860 [Patescibacteria group bacterium]